MTELRCLQWNARGVISKWAIIKPFLVSTACSILCLQESHFLPTDHYEFTIPGYTSYNVYGSVERRQGGSSLYINNNLPQYQIDLQTDLQAIACMVRFGNRRVTFCSLYLPPTERLNYNRLDELIQELPEPFVLSTDANSRHFLWGADRCDSRGMVWERIIQQHGLCVMNDGSPTRMDDFTGLDSHIDVTLCSSSIRPCTTWTTDPDLHESDHFPIYFTLQSGMNQTVENVFYGWNINKANWDKFREECDIKFDENLGAGNYELLTETILQAATRNIPIKTGQYKYNCPWWTNECKEAKAARLRALNRFRRNRGNPLLLLEFKKAKAKARQITRKAKKDSWEKMLQMFNHTTPMAKLWDIIRRFTRKSRVNKPLPVLKVNDQLVDDPVEVGNVLGQYYSDISSAQNYTPWFCERENEIINTFPDFDSENQECYNVMFDLNELKNAIEQSGNTSIGPDRIHYAFLKHMNETQMLEILKLFNYIWVEKDFPKEWTHSLVIPILKPGKPACDPKSYRPIQLTSCMSKTFERMVAKRMSWYIEHNEILSPNQCAFRKGRCTTDHIVRLESEVRRGFFYNKYTLAVFLDFKSAYNLTSPPALLLKMYNLGFRGRLMNFIHAYLGERTFQVRNGQLSDTFRQDKGLVQGGVISPLLFNLMINDIFDGLPRNFSTAIYADDCTLWLQGRDATQLVHAMQQALNSLAEWAKTWGFTYTPSKCKAMFFRRYMNRRELENIPELTLNNEHLQYVESMNFLGVCLDSRLNMNEHIKYVKARALKRVPILKCLAGRGCGADRTILIRVYKSLIRPILEYACQVLEGPLNKAVESLESVQNTCLRIATGALRTSPIIPLQVETNVQPLYLRRWELTLRYVTKVISAENHPCHKLVDGSLALPAIDAEYLKRIAGFPLYERVKRLTENLTFDIPYDVTMKGNKYPPWMRHRAVTKYLLNNGKHLMNDCEVLEAYNEFRQAHNDAEYIFTDGSKSDSGVGCAFVHSGVAHEIKLSSRHSVFTAETLAILRAILYIRLRDSPKYVICTDSKSAVQAILADESVHPMIIDIQDLLHDLKEEGRECVVLWVPGHRGIHGNEVADMHAKQAAQREETEDYRVSLREYVPLMRTACFDYFERVWRDYDRRTNLKEIKSHVQPWSSCIRNVRREEIILCRLRLGHTRLTHGYILDREQRPECRRCNVYLTVRHILIDCILYNDERRPLQTLCQQHRVPVELSTIMGDLHPDILDAVFQFLRACDIFSSL